MASVFTYDPEPPRVSSPWPTSFDPVLQDPSRFKDLASDAETITDWAHCSTLKLAPEPQDGPIEYKLHLLLRPRRKLSASTTVLRVSGSSQSKIRETQASAAARSNPTLMPMLPAPSNQSRQNRLQNLTTQLLWRLQQSSPHHSTSRSDLVIPTLLDDRETSANSSAGRRTLLPGLEESQGALYEIGVSDDGAFVGLVRDELEESLSTLSVMAYSLGCRVNVLRKAMVGRCQWIEEARSSTGMVRMQKEGDLWVAEALIIPNLGLQVEASTSKALDASESHETFLGESIDPDVESKNHSDQLRVSLTGGTTAGKSSLLGILSTSTLDDGRGKVRKSLHKHLHEIASGITSSLVTELIGYRDTAVGSHTDIINYATEGASQWTDIHGSCDNGRLVVVTDSAGHIKYRRTTVRGLLSWAPHWTLCCIAADNEQFLDGNSRKRGDGEVILDDSGSSGSNNSRAHLELCLGLGLPLVVVITKLDLASNSGLRRLIGEVLTCLKAAGRQVAPLFAHSPPADSQELQSLLDRDLQDARNIFTSLTHKNLTDLVPIVLTSAVTGAGIRKLHALLRHLPIPHEPRSKTATETHGSDCSLRSLFHIDEVFATSDAHSIALLDGSRVVEGHVVSGHLCHGSINLGDTCFVGPFDASTSSSAGASSKRVHHARSCPALERSSTPSRGSPKITSESLTHRQPLAQDTGGHIETWQRVRVVSLRNLRLPVRQLDPGQLGTIGITDEWALQEGQSLKSTLGARIRKGMVMIRDQGGLKSEDLPACRGFVAIFPLREMQGIVSGNSVKIYVASIRASAKISGVRVLSGTPASDEVFNLDEIDGSDISDNVGSAEVSETRHRTEVTFEFQGSQEWLELGSQVLVMLEGGDSSTVGLGGFVGEITQRLE
ncbi:MAG: hypothetical protein Q9195_000047 [Heterodermia aff. obscurata]